MLIEAKKKKTKKKKKKKKKTKENSSGCAKLSFPQLISLLKTVQDDLIRLQLQKEAY